MNIRLIILALLSLTFLTQCQSLDLRYKTTQQGNLLTEKKVNRLQLGMTKQSVATTLGSSLMFPLFQSNRIDYAYTVKQAGDKMVKKRVVLYFKQDKLSKIMRSENLY